jgi:hypothetical protein
MRRARERGGARVVEVSRRQLQWQVTLLLRLLHRQIQVSVLFSVSRSASGSLLLVMHTKTVTITGEESLLLLPARSKGDFQQNKFTYEESFALSRPRSNSLSFTEAFWDAMKTKKACAREDPRLCGVNYILRRGRIQGPQPDEDIKPR